MPRAALAVIVCLLLTAAPACGRGSSAGGQASVTPSDPASDSPTDRAIAAAQNRLSAVPNDPDARIALAEAFLQKVRETADPSYYTKADGLLASVGGAHSPHPEALLAEGTLLLARHQFAEALAVGQRAVAVLPYNETAYGILVDADDELGRFDDALAAVSKMVDIKPNLSSLSRLSYARELRGDLPGAIEAMTQASTSGGSAPENVSYVQTLLGNLLLLDRRPDEADKAYGQALASFQGFPAALAGQASVLVARGQPDRAAEVMDRVIQVQPLLAYVIADGDDWAAAGQADKAARSYALVRAIARLYRANKVNIDVDLALFDADHHPGAASVSEARRGLRDRPSELGHDVLAWNLFMTRRLDEAWAESQKALVLGDRDPLLHYHAAMIAKARNDPVAAKRHLQDVLDTNPRFNSAYAASIVTLAGSLGLTVPS